MLEVSGRKEIMFNLPKIGFIGLGFVGEAIRNNYDGAFHNICIDTDASRGYAGTYTELMSAEGIFVCVPSPQRLDGSCNTDILESVLYNLKDYKGVIISKVTATPDEYERLGKLYPNLVHVPEFLTAAKAAEDYAKENWAIIGGNVLAYQREAERIIRYTKPQANIIHCSIGEASLVKYAINSFLSTKVVFMNELAAIAEHNGYDWDNIRRMIAMDHRIGNTHTQVPGPDGQYGFGGMCFPKDTSALLHYASVIDIKLNVLKEAVKKNTLLRLQKPK
jgi:UDPglucose 6-dehydrogenase